MSIRILLLILIFSPQVWSAEGAHGFITYLQRCDGPSPEEKKILQLIEKTDAFSFKRDIYYMRLQKEKFTCLKQALSDYAFKMNPTMKQIHDQRAYRVIFTQLAIWVGQAKVEHNKTNIIEACKIGESFEPNDCAKRMSEQLTHTYFMLNAVDRLVVAVGDAYDREPGLSLVKVENSIERQMDAEIKKLSDRAKAAREISLPAAVR